MICFYYGTSQCYYIFQGFLNNTGTLIRLAKWQWNNAKEYDSDVIMSTIASLITSLTIVYSTVYSDADQRKHQSPAPLAFVRGIHRRPVNSPHKWPVTRKMFPFDDAIMYGWIYHLNPQMRVIHTCSQLQKKQNHATTCAYFIIYALCHISILGYVR